MKKSKYNRLLIGDKDSDPLSGMANLFDVSMVFAVALMVALVSSMGLSEVFSDEDFTMVKNPGKENMEIITKEGEEITRYKVSDNKESKQGKGKKVGTAYQLDDGKIIYVPD